MKRLLLLGLTATGFAFSSVASASASRASEEAAAGASAAQTGDEGQKSEVRNQKSEVRDQTSEDQDADRDQLKKIVNESLRNPSAQEGPLEQAIAGMRQAQERIDRRDTSEQTRAIQQQVIENLAKLIEQAKQQQNQPNSPPPQSPPQPMPQSEQQQQPSSADQQQESQQPQAGSQQQARQQPEDSTERADTGEKRDQDLARPEGLSVDVWGHLPPKLREQLLNTYSDKILPQYEQLVRDYYEALSEQSRKAEPKR